MKRFRIGLRLLLLIVALCAVFFAWIGARRELERVELRGEIRGLQIQRNYAAGRLNDPQEGAHWRKSMWETDELIKSKRHRLGESSR